MIKLAKLYLDELADLDVTGYGASEVLHIDTGGTQVIGDPNFTYDGTTLTLADNYSFTGTGTMAGVTTWTSGGWKLNDNVKGLLGNPAGGDFEMYSDGANTVLRSLMPDGNIYVYVNDDSQGTPDTLLMTFGGAAQNIGIGAAPTGSFKVAMESGDTQSRCLKLTAANHSAGTNVRTLQINATEQGAGAADLVGVLASSLHLGLNNISNILGMQASVVIKNDDSDGRTVADMTGMNMDVIFNSASKLSAVTDAVGFKSRLIDNTGSAANTITNYKGFLVSEASISGGLVVSNMCGLYVDPITIGTVSNCGIVLNGDGVGSDLVLGAGQDAKIYYDGTDLAVNPKVVGTGGILMGIADSVSAFWGASKDMSIIYDGTNGVINTSLIAPSDLDITCGANKTIELQNVVWDDENIGAGTLSGPPGLQPGVVNFIDNVGADTGIATFGLAVGEGLSGFLEIPHRYKEGTDITFHVHWQGIAAPTGTDNVQLQLTYTLCGENATETLPPVTIITAETAFDTQYECMITVFTAITGTNFDTGDQFMFTIERIAASVNEYGGEALLQTVGIHYQINTMGSRQITTK